jgi:uncharacterized protein (TIGR01777 family)
MKLDKLVLAGGTGFLGQRIIDHFRHTVRQIIILTRSESRKQGNLQYVNWDGRSLGDWARMLEGADVLINLTGKSVDCRYTEKNKKEIIRSRVDATHILGEALRTLKAPPALWMNAASATIYRHAEDKPMDEHSGEMGEGFSVEVCKAWEEAFEKTETTGTRKVILRLSMILGMSGGVMPVMKKLVSLGLGGKMGSGRQYISWMHEADLINALEWIIERQELSGPINLSAPEPLTNKQFMETMRRILKKPFGLPAPAWLLGIGAFFIRTETELILKSRRVVPERLLRSGFKFRFTRAEQALSDLLK